MSLVELAGQRVLLRQLGPQDAPRLAEFLERNRRHLAPWSPAVSESFFTVESCRERLARNIAESQAGTSLRLHLVAPDDPGGDVLGHVSLSQISRGYFQNAYVGYALGQSAVGRGLMTEALRLLVAHAFGSMLLHRLSANYMPENVRSARVLSRLGFQPEGLAKDYLFIAGAWRDHVLTSLTNPDHPGPEAAT